MNGKAQAIVAAIMIAMLGWLTTDQRALRTYVHAEIATVREDIASLCERMARLEGLFEGHVKGDCSE